MRSFSRVLKGAAASGEAQVIHATCFPELDTTLAGVLPYQESASDPDAAPGEAKAAPARPPEEAEAERLLMEARLQAAECLHAAEARARAVEAEAREQGYRAGLEAAREAQRALLAEVEALRAEVHAERERFFDGLEPEVVQLALGVAEKIIRQEVDLHPEIVVGIARAALSRLKEARTVRVTASPADAEVLRARLPESLPHALDALEVAANPHVTAGGCLVDSDRGSVDARLERQLERAAAAVLEGEA